MKQKRYRNLNLEKPQIQHELNVKAIVIEYLYTLSVLLLSMPECDTSVVQHESYFTS